MKTAGSESLSKGSVFRSVCVYILAAELCERLAYYGLTGSLSIFLAEQLGFESNTASEVTSTFAALCYSTPLLGGYRLGESLYNRCASHTFADGDQLVHGLHPVWPLPPWNSPLVHATHSDCFV